MSRLRSALEGLASRGVPRGAAVLFSDAKKAVDAPSSGLEARSDQGEEIMISTSTPVRKQPGWVVFAAAFGVVLTMGVAFIFLVRPGANSSGQDVAGGGSAVDTAASGPTLAPVDGPPITVPAEAPLSYYAYLPDLHLAWRATTDGGTEICWRTPEVEGCQSDQFYAPETVTVPNGSQVIILTRPDLGQGEPGVATVEFSNGESTTQEFTTPPGIAIAYARVELPQGATVVTATASS